MDVIHPQPLHIAIIFEKFGRAIPLARQKVDVAPRKIVKNCSGDLLQRKSSPNAPQPEHWLSMDPHLETIGFAGSVPGIAFFWPNAKTGITSGSDCERIVPGDERGQARSIRQRG
jgi:hypothetical protein